MYQLQYHHLYPAYLKDEVHKCERQLSPLSVVCASLSAVYLIENVTIAKVSINEIRLVQLFMYLIIRCLYLLVIYKIIHQELSQKLTSNVVLLENLYHVWLLYQHMIIILVSMLSSRYVVICVILLQSYHHPFWCILSPWGSQTEKFYTCHLLPNSFHYLQPCCCVCHWNTKGYTFTWQCKLSITITMAYSQYKTPATLDITRNDIV